MSNTAEKIEEQPPADTALVLYQRMLGVTITNQESYGLMAEIVKKAKEGKKAVEAFFKPMKQKADEAKKEILGAEKEQLAPYLEIEATGQGAMNLWLNEEKKRQEAEERRRREAAAEQARLEREELERSAAALESSGANTAAAALRQEAERVVEAPVFVPTVDKTVRAGGVTASAKKELVVQVSDKLAFLAYLVEKKSACVFVEFKASELKAWARSQGLKNGEVPGLLIEERLASSIR